MASDIYHELDKQWTAVVPGDEMRLADIHTDSENPIRDWALRAERLGEPGRPEMAFGALNSDGYLQDTVAYVRWEPAGVRIGKRSHPQPTLRLGGVRDVSTETWSTNLGPAYPRFSAEVWGDNPSVQQKFKELISEETVQFEPTWAGVAQDVVTLRHGVSVVAGSTLLGEPLSDLNRYHYLFGAFKRDLNKWILSRELDAEYVAPRADGRPRVLLRQLWDNNYGHIMIDLLPRVFQLQERGRLYDYAFVISPHDPGSPYPALIKDCLSRVGVSDDQIEVAPRCAQYDELIVLGKVSAEATRHAPRAVDWVRDHGRGVAPRGAQRIYVQRSTVARRPENEAELLEVVAPLGFDVVRTSELTLNEQIALFKGASHVIAINGADLTNVVFSPDDVSVLALSTEKMSHDYFYDLLCHRPKARYLGLQGRATDPDRAYHTADFVVDLDVFKNAVNWLIGS